VRFFKIVCCFKGWRLTNALQEAIGLNSFLEENQVSLEIAPYEEHQGREYFGTSSDGNSVVEEHLRKSSSVFYEAAKLFEEAENRGGTSVGIIGEPGAGKTILSKKLLRLKATNASQDEKESLYLFHVKFRDMDINKETNVLEFLVKALVANWKFEHEKDQELLEQINNSCEVYIIADGLDEADDKLFSSPLDPASKMGLYDTATPDVIIKNLLAGRIFPKAKKVVTSRPDAFLNLHKDFKPNFNVRILGLSLESQETLGLQLCNKSVAEYSKVKEKLDANPDLRSFCYNPLQCNITVQVLRWMQLSEHVSTITSTLIFVENLLRILKRNEDLRSEILQTVKELAKLAVSGMNEDKFIFDKNNLNNLKHETLKQFFLAKTASIRLPGEGILEGDKKFFFTHLLWQEFFAAIWLMFVANKKQFREVLKVLSGTRWRVVLKFAFGLQNDKVTKKIMTMFESFDGKSDASLLSNKCKALRKFHQNALDNGSITETCRWALEANQPSLNEDVAERLPKSLTLPLTLSQSDACAIAHALSIKPSIRRQIEMKHSSSANGTILQGDSLRILMDAVNIHGHEVIAKWNDAQPFQIVIRFNRCKSVIK